MKTILATTALAVAVFAGAASASVSNLDVSTVQSYAPGQDVSVLTDEKIRDLVNTIHGGNSPSDIRAAVSAALRNAG